MSSCHLMSQSDMFCVSMLHVCEPDMFAFLLSRCSHLVAQLKPPKPDCRDRLMYLPLNL